MIISHVHFEIECHNKQPFTFTTSDNQFPDCYQPLKASNKLGNRHLLNINSFIVGSNLLNSPNFDCLTHVLK